MFRVKADNVFSYKEIDFDFAGRGLCLLEGQNKDEPTCKSNASGKTSLPDTLCWGLFGKSLKSKTPDKVVNNKVGKDCKVEVEWSNYRVVRYRKHTQFKNDLQFYHHGNEITAKSNKDTQELIDNALGLSYESFINSVYFQQNNLTAFAMATDSEQKMVIENILGLNVISEAQKVAKEAFDELEKEAAKQELIVTNGQASLTNGLIITKQLTAKSEQWKKDKETAIQTCLQQIDSFKNKIAPSTDFDFEEAKQIIEIASLVPAEARETEKQIADLNRNLAAINQRRALLEQVFKGHIANYQTKEKQIKAYREQKIKTCLTCKQPIGMQKFIDSVAVMDQELLLLETKAVEAEAAFKAVEPAVDIADKLKSLNEELQAKRQIIEMANSLKVRMAQEEGKLKVQVQIDAYIASAKKSLAEVEGRINPFTEMLVDEQAKQDKLQVEITEASQHLTNIRNKQAYYSYWVQGLANSKLKSYIMDAITPMLNERANHYSGFLTGGSTTIEISTLTKLKNGDMRDKFSINIHSPSNADYEQLSGGEKKRIDICILLALQDLVRARAKNPIDLVIMDECCENIDEVGIERLLDLLHNISSEHGSCFYVTHSDEMKTLFPNVITVVKENGISKVLAE